MADNQGGINPKKRYVTVYTQKNWKQGLSHILVHQCSWQHYSQCTNAENNPNVHWQMNKQNVVYRNSGILFSLKKEWNSFFYWSIVDLQSCVNFCCTAKWFSYIYVYIFYIPFHYGLSQDIEYSFPVIYSRTLLFIHSIYNSLHLLIPNSQSIPPRSPPPRQPQVCSLCLWVCFLCLWVCFCFIDRFICVIF